MHWEKTLDLYDQLVTLCQSTERKGKTMPYTSDNGYMFSLLNKSGELGMHLPKTKQKEFKIKYQSGDFFLMALK